MNTPLKPQLHKHSVSNCLSSRQNRIEIVNEIIKEIASRGRNFFKYKENVANVFWKNNRLYMLNEYNGKDMCLSTKNHYPPKHWHHGGTLWGLTRDFKDFILTGEKSNHNHGYGGLLCPHWGYPESDMKAIQDKAVTLGYL
jgi:calcineurin-like phosphoesterase family protein